MECVFFTEQNLVSLGWNRSKLNEVSGKEDFALELEGGESFKVGNIRSKLYMFSRCFWYFSSIRLYKLMLISFNVNAYQYNIKTKISK